MEIVYKAALNDLGGAIGTHIWFLNAENAWCLSGILCIYIQSLGDCGGN